MNWIDSTVAQWWAEALLRASVQGGIVIVVAGAALRLLSSERFGGALRLGPAAGAWVWRIVLLKMLIGLTLPLTVMASSPSGGLRVPGLSAPAAPVSGSADESLIAVASVAPGASVTLPQVIVLLSTVGVIAWLALLLIDGLAVGRLLRATHECDRPEIMLHAHRIADRMGLRTMPDVRESSEVDRPMLVCGSLRNRRPVVVLPTNLLDDNDPESARALLGALAHELAHARRHDLAWGWLAAVAGAVFFFHPLVWWANVRLRRAQDEACDALALSASQVSAAEYGRLLLRLAQSAAAPPPLPQPLAAGVVENFQSLRRRLLLLARPAHTWRAAPLVIVALLCLAAAPTWRIHHQSPAPERNANVDLASLDLGNILYVESPDGQPMSIPVIIGDGPGATMVPFTSAPAGEAVPRFAAPADVEDATSDGEDAASPPSAQGARRMRPGTPLSLFTPAGPRRPGGSSQSTPPAKMASDPDLSSFGQAVWERAREEHVGGAVAAPAVGHSPIGAPWRGRALSKENAQ